MLIHWKESYPSLQSILKRLSNFTDLKEKHWDKSKLLFNLAKPTGKTYTALFLIHIIMCACYILLEMSVKNYRTACVVLIKLKHCLIHVKIRKMKMFYGIDLRCCITRETQTDLLETTVEVGKFRYRDLGSNFLYNNIIPVAVLFFGAVFVSWPIKQNKVKLHGKISYILQQSMGNNNKSKVTFECFKAYLEFFTEFRRVWAQGHVC